MTIVLAALIMSALMIFAAFAIDVGGAYNQRRQYQSQVDAGVLAAAQSLSNSVDPESDSTGATRQLIDRVNQNLVTAFPDTDFNKCADSPPTTLSTVILPSKTTISWVHPYVDAVSKQSYSCIAYDTSGSMVWVEIPRTQPYATAFGQFTGRKTIVIGASAVAGGIAGGLGGVLPFGIPAGTTVDCLKTGAQSPDPCNGPDVGSFGDLDILQYGNPVLGTSASCTGNGGGPTGRFANNIAVGADHHLGSLPGSRHDDCSTLNPDDVSGQPGTSSDFDSGILSGSSFSDNQPARLRRVGSRNQVNIIATTTVSKFKVDDQPLWSFISNYDGSATAPVPTTPTIGDIPPHCQGYYFRTLELTSGASKKAIMHQALVDCFNEYSYGDDTSGKPCTTSAVGCTLPTTCTTDTTPTQCTGVMFDRNTQNEKPFNLYDIQDSARFVYVPVLTAKPANCANSWCNVIKTFNPVWLQQLYGGCDNKKPQSCKMDFEPGVGDGGSQADKDGSADAVVALVFNLHMVPPGLANPYQPGVSAFSSLLR